MQTGFFGAVINCWEDFTVVDWLYYSNTFEGPCVVTSVISSYKY